MRGDRGELMNMGAAALRLIRDHGVDRVAAMEAVAKASLDFGNPQPFCSLGPSFALAWAECGFPIAEPSHRLAASLMATSMPQEFVDEFVRMPWRCFGIACPAGVIGPGDGFALALSNHGGRILMLSFVDGHMQFGDESSIADWNKLLLETMNIGGDPIGPSHQDFEASTIAFRRTELLGRLFVGVCAEMGPMPRHTNNAHRSPSKKNHRDSEPRTTVFKLTRSVNVDARPIIRAYADGGSRKSPTVQVLVRGHWKLQPHGVARASRRLIHVEPYWRGEDDAPIAVRPHALRRKTDGAQFACGAECPDCVAERSGV